MNIHHMTFNYIKKHTKIDLTIFIVTLHIKY